MRDGIVFYASFYEAIKGLDAGDFKDCVMALMEYGLYGNEVEMTGVAKMFFTMAKPQVDANNKRFENGKRGGRPAKTESKPKENQNETKQKPSDNQSEIIPEPKVKDKEKVKEKVKDKEKVKRESEPAEPINVEVLYPEIEERSIYAPQLIDVQEFCALKGLTISPEAFFHHYESVNWQIGGQPIYDWKSKAMSWDADEKKKQNARMNTNGGTGSRFADVYRREFGDG